MLSILREAGWPIWPLLATSVLGLALIFERFLSLRRGLVMPRGLNEQVAEMLRNRQDTPESINRLERNSPLGRVLAEVMRHRHLPREELRNVVEDAGRAVAHDLSRYISAIGTIAVIAPLMGLFGTVVGMIEIFGSYTPGGGDPTQLARGISIALYNTGFGILIAIPAMIAHRYLRGRVDGYLSAMEQSASRLVRAVSHQAAPPRGPFMNFRGSRGERDELDINLIPLIDVLLVILIFLAATTSFARFTQLKVTLPQASMEQDTPPALEVAVSQDGRYALNGTLIDVSTPPEIADALRQAAAGKTEPLVVINADAQATHQSVINVMEAARLAGIGRVNFAAQTAR